MKRIGAALAAIAVAALGTLAIASPASAHHNEVIADITVDGCILTGTSSWKIDLHQVPNTELVVLVDGAVHHAVVGTPLNVDLPPGTTEIKWRVWGGGERNYDKPALTDLAALLDHISGGGSPLDANAPGVAWYTKDVDDCKSGAPTTEPTTPPTSETTTTTATETTTTSTQTTSTETTSETTSATTTTTKPAALPVTGASLGGLIAVAVALIGGGVALLMLRRRRANAEG